MRPQYHHFRNIPRLSSYHHGRKAIHKSTSTTTPVFQTTRRYLTQTINKPSPKEISKITPQGRNWQRLRYIAKGIKYIRIPTLIMSVYAYGHQQGIIDYSCDPAKKEIDLLRSVLSGVGADLGDIRVVHDGKLSSQNNDDEKLTRVVSAGRRILRAAKIKVRDEMDSAIRACGGEEQDMDKLMQDIRVAPWHNAQRRIEGPWQYVLIESMVPNAFVSEILPRRIFITTSLLDNYIENEDELGLVLGHEISHLILGHITKTNALELWLRTLEVLLLSIDPSEGALSIGILSLLEFIRNLVMSAHSRETEREADELGIVISAMACYDTQKGAFVFTKLSGEENHEEKPIANKNTSNSGAASLKSFFASHPPSLERYDSLLQASKEENKEKYKNSTCASTGKAFFNMMRRHKPDLELDITR